MRISGVYWGLNALHLLGQPDGLPYTGLHEFVFSCYQECGGFGAAPGHDPHLLNTVYAIQILSMTDGFEWFEKRVSDCKMKIAKYIAGLQRTDGTFAGDRWGEIDTRFLYGAFNGLSLLGLMPHQSPEAPPLINVEAATSHIKACQNFDGAFGLAPGAESHSGQVFTCVGALHIAGELDKFLGETGKDRLGAWLSERQLRKGGLNGRPEKLEDVCYSWWVMSSLALIGRLHWIDKSKLTTFILQCQDLDDGGLADRPGDMVDVFHTNFGLAGLSLLGRADLLAVDPA